MAKKRSYNDMTGLVSDCPQVDAKGKVGKAGYYIGRRCHIYIESFRGGKKRIRVLKGIGYSKMILGNP